MPAIPLHRMPTVFSSYGRHVRNRIPIALSRVAREAGKIIADATRKAPPASPRGSVGAVNYGTFLSNWRSQVTSQNGNQGVLVSNASGLKGATIEWGGRWPNKAPPVDAIATWATKKLGLSYPEAKKAAWPISRAIKRRGLQPRLVMSGDNTKTAFKLSMQNAFAGVVTKAADRLARFT